jgi:hypothetical protein
VEGESPLGGGGVSWCHGFVSAVDLHELAQWATRNRYKQGDRARRREFLEYAVDVAIQSALTLAAKRACCQAR